MTKEAQARLTAEKRPLGVGCPPSKRFLLFNLDGLSKVQAHAKVVGYLLARHRLAPIFTRLEHHLLMVIGCADKPPWRHQWALRELSKRVALLDLDAGVELDS
jgi:hypothetical protein